MSIITLLTIIFLVLGIMFFISRLQGTGPFFANTWLVVAVALIAVIILYIAANGMIGLK